jgi:cyclomaltodextrinase
MNHTHWFKRAVIYQVFVDRFHGFHSTENIRGFAGGNLSGVTEKLDHFKSLGIDVIWLSPFYKTVSYHGYHITGFTEVDPHFGNREDLTMLIRAAEELGIRVIADFVPNHCSVYHPFFQDAIHQQNSPYRNWFIFDKWPDRYRCFLNYKGLPKLNLDHPDARRYIIEAAEQWLSMGLKGFRLDHVIGPSHTFWRIFSQAIRTKFPDVVLIGEAWAQGLERKYFNTIGIRNRSIRKFTGISQENVQMEYMHELDGVLDFWLRNLIKEAVDQGTDLRTDPGLKDQIDRHLQKVPEDYYLVSFLDNHDMDRFIRYCGGDVEKLLEAFELLLSLDQPVVIYTGTENCIPNEKEVNPMTSHSDLLVRAPMDWDHLQPAFMEGFAGLVRRYRNG